MNNILALETEVDSLNNKIIQLVDFSRQLREAPALTMEMALECDAVAPEQNILNGYFSSTSKSNKPKIALEGIVSGIIEFIKKAIAKVSEWISNLIKWLTGNKDKTPTPENIVEHEKGMEEVVKSAHHSDILQLVNGVTKYTEEDVDKAFWKQLTAGYKELYNAVYFDILDNGQYTKICKELSVVILQENVEKEFSKLMNSFMECYDKFTKIADDYENEHESFKSVGGIKKLLVLTPEQKEQKSQWRARGQAILKQADTEFTIKLQELNNSLLRFADMKDKALSIKEKLDAEIVTDNKHKVDIIGDIVKIRKLVIDIDFAKVAEKSPSIISLFEDISTKLKKFREDIMVIRTEKDEADNQNTSAEMYRYFYFELHRIINKLSHYRSTLKTIATFNLQCNNLDKRLLKLLSTTLNVVENKLKKENVIFSDEKYYSKFRDDVIKQMNFI